jgi:hypothetical protein
MTPMSIGPAANGNTRVNELAESRGIRLGREIREE